MSGSMSRLMLTAAVSLLSVAFAAGAARALEMFFNENGEYSCNGCSNGMTSDTDPGNVIGGVPEEGIFFSFVVLPEKVMTGTVGIYEQNGVLSDALSFTARGLVTEMTFYSFDSFNLVADHAGSAPPGFIPDARVTENADGS